MNSKDLILGIDVGGTGTKIGIVTLEGEIIDSVKIKTNSFPLFEDYIEALSAFSFSLANKNKCIKNIVGIGVGAPNANHFNGNIEYAANLPWKGIVPFSSELSKKMGLPVVVTNDANAAAFGEKCYGVAKDMKNFVMITLGTGIGSGIFIDNKLVYGHKGFAGELGHLRAIKGGRKCGCGRTGCIETYASATGVVRSALEFLKEYKDSSINLIAPEKLTSFDVYKEALKGDELALKVFDFTGKILGETFADIVLFSNPEAIVLFGGLAESGEILFAPLLNSFKENVMEVFADTKILKSELSGSNAAILGAAAVFKFEKYNILSDCK